VDPASQLWTASLDFDREQRGRYELDIFIENFFQMFSILFLSRTSPFVPLSQTQFCLFLDPFLLPFLSQMIPTGAKLVAVVTNTGTTFASVDGGMTYVFSPSSSPKKKSSLFLLLAHFLFT